MRLVSPPETAPESEPCVDMHHYATMMHMRTTMILDQSLLDEARRLTGLTEKTAVVHAGLEALIARESARRLAALGGSDPRAAAPARRRPAPRRRR
jgi:Arc/MetJ family transcription regulator